MSGIQVRLGFPAASLHSISMSRQKQASLDDQSLEELYDTFSLKAWDLPQVTESFEMLKRKLKLEKLHGLELYKELKSALGKVWKAKEVLSLLDRRANQKEYMGQVSIGR